MTLLDFSVIDNGLWLIDFKERNSELEINKTSLYGFRSHTLARLAKYGTKG